MTTVTAWILVFGFANNGYPPPRILEGIPTIYETSQACEDMARTVSNVVRYTTSGDRITHVCKQQTFLVPSK